jgi:hypothetical protein
MAGRTFGRICCSFLQNQSKFIMAERSAFTHAGNYPKVRRVILFLLYFICLGIDGTASTFRR